MGTATEPIRNATLRPPHWASRIIQAAATVNRLAPKHEF